MSLNGSDSLTVNVDFSGTRQYSFSWTQISKFLDCQAKHRFEYTLGWRSQKQGRGRTLGTLVHDMLDQWWNHADWERPAHAFVEANDRVFEEHPLRAWDPQAAEEIALDAMRLIRRYEEQYASNREEAVVVLQPTRFKVGWADEHILDGAFIEFVFIIDRLIGWNDRWFLHEVKTMSRWGREELLEHDRQLTAYLWGLSMQPSLDRQVWGAMFDAILTTKWKEERKPVESFRRIFTDRDRHQLKVFESDLQIAIGQIIAAIETGATTRNMRPDCSMCDYLAPCMEEILGADPTPVLQENYQRRNHLKVVQPGN